MAIRYYNATFVMRSRDISTLRITDLWTFKSLKSNKRYIVEVEHFSNHFFGLKFYWKGVADSKDRYSLLTYDYEPRTIVMSCIRIMLNYYHKDAFSSFGFVAAPDLNCRKDSCPNKRFRLYRNLLLNIFGGQTFIQAYDLNTAVYVLINRKSYDAGRITIQSLESEISRLYDGDYELVADTQRKPLARGNAGGYRRGGTERRG